MNQSDPLLHDDVIQDANLSFWGKGSTYFGIVILNAFLTVITLGLYYPWAKAAYRRYLWNETAFLDSQFVFNGTGKEMFKGFLISYGIIVGFYISISLSMFFSYAWIITLALFSMMIVLIPFAIFGAWRYRVSRTSWRGIFFSFDGDLWEFIRLFLPLMFLTIITFGIYASWMNVKIRKYLFSHTSIGDLQFDFHGRGEDLFFINLVGVVLFYPTIFMYTPIWIKKRFNFSIDHITIADAQNEIALESSLSNSEAWTTLVTNALLLIVTLGLAFPWTLMRSMRMFFENANIPMAFDYDNLHQSENHAIDATGDEMADILDIGLDF